MKKYLIYIFIIGFIACGKKQEAIQYQFKTLDAKTTGLQFTNTLHPTADFNMMKYMYFYNGAGLGAGDFNNDGKIDLFFASNQEQNKLFINEGKMHFKDVTKEAQIPTDSSWSTGVSIIDINNDGLLDIYVCRVGNYKILHGKNQLLICKGLKNGIPYYENEAAKYHLDISAFCTQAAFFDYDLDGDLDMFLLHHSVNHDGNFAPRNLFLNTYDSLAGDQFFKNDNGSFVEVTKETKINSSKIGYGLGIAVSDINLDGYPDIYIGNDFHENDYLYINQKDGTFKEMMQEQMMHTSQFSMGVDIADINNDAFPEIVSMDMLPDDPKILKRSLGEDEYQTFMSKLKYNYSYQYARNNLQLNNKNGTFSEIGFYSGIYATDWSWSALWMDFDNDAKKDLFISNGIPKRLNDIDYINYVSNDVMQEKMQNNQVDEKELAVINKFPEIKLPNRFFHNKGNAAFDDISKNVLNTPNTFSNGAIYADLDNDGDLDIVVNNIKDPALVYENIQETKNVYCNFNLQGNATNQNAIGSKVFVFNKKEIYSYENNPAKGFLSSMILPIHVSLGNSLPDSIILVWNDNTYQKIIYDSTKRNINIKWQKELPTFDYDLIKNFTLPTSSKFNDITAATKIDFLHQDNELNEYNREALLPRMFTKEGPALCVGDVNGDGLEDVYCGNAKWKASVLYLQNANGTFKKTNQPDFVLDSTYEDVDACFVDLNNDKFLDLVVASGGNEFYKKEEWLQPRVYMNDGKGNFKKQNNSFPDIYTTQSCVKANDFNGDGFMDLFIGGRVTPFAYGVIPKSFLLQNDGAGHFKDVTETLAKGLKEIGFVTNAVWCDVDGDKVNDLVITKEWGTIDAFIHKKGTFEKKILTDKLGWWNVTVPVDIDNDGDIDFIAGNQSENCRLQPTSQYPVKMYYADFDNNGTKEQVITYFQNGKEIPLATKMELEKQMPMLKKKFLYAEDFANASINDMFTKSALQNAIKFEVNYFSNAILINDGKGNFSIQKLPWQNQLSPLKDAVIANVNNDNLPDILTFGNFYEQMMPLNRNDASYGNVLVNKGNAQYTAENLNGVIVKNQVRHVKPIMINKKTAFVLIKNNDSLQVIQ